MIIRSNYSFLLLISLCFLGCSRSNECESDLTYFPPLSSSSSQFDSIKAKELGADEYGMKSYFMVFLKDGPNRTQNEEETAKIQADHLANIHKLADSGILVLAGPFLDEGEIRGVFLFNVDTKEEAEALTKTDPAVIEGRLNMEIHPFYGSAAIMELNEIHDQISKIKF